MLIILFEYSLCLFTGRSVDGGLRVTDHPNRRVLPPIISSRSSPLLGGDRVGGLGRDPRSGRAAPESFCDQGDMAGGPRGRTAPRRNHTVAVCDADYAMARNSANNVRL